MTDQFKKMHFQNFTAKPKCYIQYFGIGALLFLLIKEVRAATYSKTTSQHHPQQIHISLGNHINDIVILWTTKLKANAAIRYGEDENKLKYFTGESIVFSESLTPHFHRVYLTDLVYGRRYYYRILTEVDDISSKLYSFRVPSSNPNTINTYMIYGDLGTVTRSMPFVGHEAINRNYTAIFHVGDIAYNLNIDNGQVGDRFMNMIQIMAARIPYMTGIGDHEWPDDFKQYRHRFSMPDSAWPMAVDKLWYSFNIGITHFVMISTEVYFRDTEHKDMQLDWLIEDLSNANKIRSEHPWIVVMGHRPMYCSTSDTREDCTNVDSLLRRELEDVFFSQGVDLYISGHEHLYERTWPVYKSRALGFNYKNSKGPVHIVCGTFGNVYLTDSISLKLKGWSAFTSSENDMELFGRMTVYNSTHLSWEAVLAHNLGIHDTLWIRQHHHGPFTMDDLFPDTMVEETESGSEGSILGRYKYYVLFLFILVVIFILVRGKFTCRYIQTSCGTRQSYI